MQFLCGFPNLLLIYVWTSKLSPNPEREPGQESRQGKFGQASTFGAKVLICHVLPLTGYTNLSVYHIMYPRSVCAVASHNANCAFSAAPSPQNLKSAIINI